MGRSSGGLTTKLHAACDGLGDPLRFLAGPGQKNDTKRAAGPLDGFAPEHVIADRAYDADTLLDAIAAVGAIAVVPPKSNRVVPRPYDEALYKERNLIERPFDKLKAFRRVATRYDKLLVNYLGFVKLAAILLWLK